MCARTRLSFSIYLSYVRPRQLCALYWQTLGIFRESASECSFVSDYTNAGGQGRRVKIRPSHRSFLQYSLLTSRPPPIPSSSPRAPPFLFSSLLFPFFVIHSFLLKSRILVPFSPPSLPLSIHTYIHIYSAHNASEITNAPAPPARRYHPPFARRYPRPRRPGPTRQLPFQQGCICGLEAEDHR